MSHGDGPDDKLWGLLGLWWLLGAAEEEDEEERRKAKEDDGESENED